MSQMKHISGRSEHTHAHRFIHLVGLVVSIGKFGIRHALAFAKNGWWCYCFSREWVCVCACVRVMMFVFDSIWAGLSLAAVNKWFDSSISVQSVQISFCCLWYVSYSTGMANKNPQTDLMKCAHFTPMPFHFCEQQAVKAKEKSSLCSFVRSFE